MSLKVKQLNPFELKSALIKLLEKINSVSDIENCLADIDILDAQDNKIVMAKLLFKELACASAQKIPLICFLLEHFISKEELIKGYWDMLNNKTLQPDVKITIINILRELDSDWSLENCEDLLADEDILDEGTRQLLDNAIINPETQIDFMDFLYSIKTEDKITLINSFSRDFSDDALANILIPIFESKPNSPEGREALRILGQTKSQLALHTLNEMSVNTNGELNQLIRKSLAELKMSGVREDNTKEFYAKLLTGAKPDKFYLTYPDAHGDMAMIFTRITEEQRVRFVSIVVNLDNGIKDCFGFYDISQFECDKILERFLRDEKVVSLAPECFKTILYNAEKTTLIRKNKEWELPYEYVCWRNLIIDIDYDDEDIEQILKTQIIPAKVDISVLEKLSDMKISAHWFLDGGYSDEFEYLVKELKGCSNLDDLVEDYYAKIFYPEEKQSWRNKLLMSAYIKYLIGKEDDASEIYGIVLNLNVFEEFLKEVLKRSIYEYLITVKYNKDLNSENFTDEEISSKIKYIESKWVK